MIEFKNRSSSNISRRLLKVRDRKLDENGNIEELLVDIERSEGSISEVGTKLNADNLNAIFKSTNEAIDFIFKGYLTIENNLTVSWIQTVGSRQTKSFRIDMSRRLYAKTSNINTNFLTVTPTNNLNNIQIKVDETTALNNTTGSTTKIFNFYVDLYLESTFINRVSRIMGTVNYTNTSAAPID